MTVPATTSLSDPTTVVPMPTCLVADVIHIVSLPMFSVLGIAIVLAFTVSVSPPASPSTVLPVLLNPVTRNVEPSNVMFADAASTPELLYWTCVLLPAAFGVAVSFSTMPVDVPSHDIDRFEPAGTVTVEPPASDVIVIGDDDVLRTIQKPPTPDGTV